MIRSLLSGFLAGCLFFSISSCKSDSSAKRPDDRYLNNDFKPDPYYPGGQVELQIPSSGSIMYGFAYTADGKGPHPTVVLLHGLPGNERGLDLAQNLRRAGYNVLFFNYRGSWGSQGRFSFKNSIADARAVVDFVTDSLNSENLKVDPERLAMYGHSMGAGISLIAGLSDSRVKAVIGTSVFNPYTLLQGEEAHGNLISLKEYLSTLGMLNCDPNRFLDDILKELPDYNIEKMIAASAKPTLVIDEHMSNSGFTQFNKKPNFRYKVWNTDHVFSNRRVALTREIKGWLDKTLAKDEPEKGAE